jgi:hypothetical protein
VTEIEKGKDRERQSERGGKTERDRERKKVVVIDR